MICSSVLMLQASAWLLLFISYSITNSFEVMRFLECWKQYSLHLILIVWLSFSAHLKMSGSTWKKSKHVCLHLPYYLVFYHVLGNPVLESQNLGDVFDPTIAPSRRSLVSGSNILLLDILVISQNHLLWLCRHLVTANFLPLCCCF